ncbi:stromal ascorbate peroxidase [Actinidia rufa]|uniref:Stromal ascorbate peroxidase n=1 Tax=Actinidia rufa TaxID=165716 RepID=A0A7J0GGC7_9ERIC|nr:stromal ascorbate peroxidase [Actinidia rufa]
MENQKRHEQPTRSARKSLKRKLGEYFGADSKIATLSPRQTHQDLIREIRTQVEILDSTFSSIRRQARSSRYLRTREECSNTGEASSGSATLERRPKQFPEIAIRKCGPPTPAAHLRDVFYRMGLNDKENSCSLSGAHTLGRSRPERSGWGKPETKYTVRLGWHDAGTYNKDIEEWPQRGGANGSLRFEVELKHAANAGLLNALKLIQPIKDKYTGVTYADLCQLASATAIEEAGGPKIRMKYGRVDISGPEQCPEEGRLPERIMPSSGVPLSNSRTCCLIFWEQVFDFHHARCGPPTPAAHLRDVFYRMGLNDKEIVALSGAHTLGRSRPERSRWGKPETKYTKDGPGAPGGQSWTAQWLKFDNSYFKDIKERRDEDLLVLPTDAALFEDPSFKVYAEKYAEDQDAFFKDYAEAHAKLSNLGAKFDPPEGIPIDDGPAKGAPEKFVAAKYSSGKFLQFDLVFFVGIIENPFSENSFFFTRGLLRYLDESFVLLMDIMFGICINIVRMKLTSSICRKYGSMDKSLLSSGTAIEEGCFKDSGWMGPKLFNLNCLCHKQLLHIKYSKPYYQRRSLCVETMQDMMLCGGSDTVIIQIGLGGFVACREPFLRGTVILQRLHAHGTL